MYLRRGDRNKDGKRHGDWAWSRVIVRREAPAARGGLLGEMDAAGRLGIDDKPQVLPQLLSAIIPGHSAAWVEVDLKRIAIERKRAFGGPWLGWSCVGKWDCSIFWNDLFLRDQKRFRR